MEWGVPSVPRLWNTHYSTRNRRPTGKPAAVRSIGRFMGGGARRETAQVHILLVCPREAKQLDLVVFFMLVDVGILTSHGTGRSCASEQ